MLNFLDQAILNVYFRAFLYLVITFIVVRFFVWLIEKIILKFTAKTKTDLDDLILKKTSKPITFLVLLIGLRIAFLEFPFESKALLLVNQIFTSLLILLLAYLIYSIFSITFSRAWKKFYVKTKSAQNEGLAHLIEGTLKVLLIVGALLYLLSYWGVAIGPFLAGLGVAGVAIAFALQASLANIFGGASIILDKSIKVGDLISLSDGTNGRVIKISLRSTRIRTGDNEVVIVPNAKLSSENIQNLAQPDPITRVIIPFSVAYGSDVEKVKKFVLEVLQKNSYKSKDKEPYVRFIEMADSSLNFKAYLFIATPDFKLESLDEANTEIYNTLNKNKIAIPFPQMDVHIKKK